MLCILIIAMLSSCRSSKEISASGGILTLKTEKDFFVAFQEQSFQYQTLSARMQFQIAFSSGTETSSRAQLKIRKNDRLQVSVQPLLGIEAFRIELTPDSLKVVDRINGRFLIDAIDHMTGDTDIDFNFYNLQALFTNQLFLPGEINLSQNLLQLFRWEQTKTGYLLRTEDRTGLQYAFTADSNEKLSATQIKDTSSHYLLNCNYENFRPVNQQLFPMNINIRLHTENNVQNFLSLNFSRVEVDVPLEMNFPVPANYRRVTLSEILHLIEQL